VDAGGDAKELIGRKVAFRDDTYCFFRILKAADCLLLPEGLSAERVPRPASIHSPFSR